MRVCVVVVVRGGERCGHGTVRSCCVLVFESEFLEILRQPGDDGLAAWNTVARGRGEAVIGSTVGGDSTSSSHFSDTTSESAQLTGPSTVEVEVQDQQVQAPASRAASHAPSVTQGPPPARRDDGDAPQCEVSSAPGPSCWRTYILSVKENFEEGGAEIGPCQSWRSSRRKLLKVSKEEGNSALLLKCQTLLVSCIPAGCLCPRVAHPLK